MASAEIVGIVNEVKSYWLSQGIEPGHANVKLSCLFNQIKESDDFSYFFTEANGMVGLYPNYSDENGFLFYPCEKLVLAKNYINNCSDKLSEYIIFSDFMQMSWWYAVGFKENTYEIVIIEDSSNYSFISNDLSHFLREYIKNSEIIYP